MLLRHENPRTNTKNIPAKKKRKTTKPRTSDRVCDKKLRVEKDQHVKKKKMYSRKQQQHKQCLKVKVINLDRLSREQIIRSSRNRGNMILSRTGAVTKYTYALTSEQKQTDNNCKK